MSSLNQLQTRVDEVVAAHGEPPWVERLILTDEVVATLICAPPGNSSRRHYHPDQDEFWIVMGGELIWEIEGEAPKRASSGHIMRVPKGVAHSIVTVGEVPSLRLAIGMPDVPHVDVKTGEVFT